MSDYLRQVNKEMREFDRAAAARADLSEAGRQQRAMDELAAITKGMYRRIWDAGQVLQNDLTPEAFASPAMYGRAQDLLNDLQRNQALLAQLVTESGGVP